MLEADSVGNCIDECGYGFLFAQKVCYLYTYRCVVHVCVHLTYCCIFFGFCDDAVIVNSCTSKISVYSLRTITGCYFLLLEQTYGICIVYSRFLFVFIAMQFHPAMKNVSGIRKQLGFPTVFNILGPLTNPVVSPTIFGHRELMDAGAW